MVGKGLEGCVVGYRFLLRETRRELCYFECNCVELNNAALSLQPVVRPMECSDMLVRGFFLACLAVVFYVCNVKEIGKKKFKLCHAS